jgi:hypothetical protein
MKERRSGQGNPPKFCPAEFRFLLPGSALFLRFAGGMANRVDGQWLRGYLG